MSKRVRISGSTYLIALTMLIIAFCGIITTGTAYAAADTGTSNGNEIAVTIDGKPLSLEVPPTIIGGRTLVPLRAIFEAMGASVDWNPATKTITGIKGNTKISLKVNSKLAYVNNSTIRIDVPATVKNGRTLVPTRFIAESLGTDVEWVSNSRTVVIVTPKEVPFPDSNLEAAIRDALKKPTGDILTSELKKITYLNADGKGISNLEGMQYLVHLKGLYLDKNKIKDISPLSGIASLEELSLFENQITDISPIKGLTGLSFLNLGSNQISDISVVANMSRLNTFYISENQVHDISPLKSNRSVKTLYLVSNPIIDISALKSLPNLEYLRLLKFDGKDKINSELYDKFDAMRNKVDEIINSIIRPDMSELEKELAIHDYIITHTRYDKENYVKDTIPDESHTAYGALVKGVAVCDGYSRTFQILLNAVGIESTMVIGDLDSAYPRDNESNSGNKKTVNHAWNIVEIGEDYFQVDVTSDDPISDDGSNILSHQYFNISDTQMAADHKWDKSAYQACTVDSNTYNMRALERKDVIIADNYYYIDHFLLLHKKALDGSSDVKLCDDTVTSICLDGEWIFYVSNADDKLYRIKTDGTEKTKLSDDEIRGGNIAVCNGLIYYLADKKIKRINSDGSYQIDLNSDSIISWFIIQDGVIYYKAYCRDYRAGLFRMDLGGSNSMRLCNDEPVGFEDLPDDMINIYYGILDHKLGEWIYFANKSDGKKIYRVKSDGSQVLKVCEDAVDTAYAEFVDNYVYYKNLDDSSKYYRIKADGTDRQPLE